MGEGPLAHIAYRSQAASYLHFDSLILITGVLISLQGSRNRMGSVNLRRIGIHPTLSQQFKFLTTHLFQFADLGHGTHFLSNRLKA